MILIQSMPAPFAFAQEPQIPGSSKWSVSSQVSPLVWQRDSQDRITWVRGGSWRVTYNDLVRLPDRRASIQAEFDDGTLNGPFSFNTSSGELNALYTRGFARLQVPLFDPVSVAAAYQAGTGTVDVTTGSILPSIYTQGTPTFGIRLPLDRWIVSVLVDRPAYRLRFDQTYCDRAMTAQMPSQDGSSHVDVPVAELPDTRRLQGEWDITKHLSLSAVSEIGNRGEAATIDGDKGVSDVFGGYEDTEMSLGSKTESIAYSDTTFDGSGNGVLLNGETLGIGLPASTVSYQDAFHLHLRTVSASWHMRERGRIASMTLSEMWADAIGSGSYDVFSLVSFTGGGSFHPHTSRLLSLRYSSEPAHGSGLFWSVEQAAPLPVLSHRHKVVTGPPGRSTEAYGGLTIMVGMRL